MATGVLKLPKNISRHIQKSLFFSEDEPCLYREKTFLTLLSTENFVKLITNNYSA